MLTLYRTERHIIAEDLEGRVVFDLQCGRDVQRLQALTKAGFELALTHPYEVVDVNKMEIV